MPSRTHPPLSSPLERVCIMRGAGWVCIETRPMHLPPIGASRRVASGEEVADLKGVAIAMQIRSWRVACRSGEEIADLKGVTIAMQIRSRRVACRSGKEFANLKGVTMQIRSRTCK